MALDLLTNTGMQENDELRVCGVRSHGFGQLAKIAMLDDDLSIESKGLLAYFASYTGAGSNTAFPGRDRILADLGINKDRFYKLFNLLKEQGYISVSQEKGNGSGRFSHNIYTIEDFPDKYASMPVGKMSDAKRSSLELIASLKDINAAGYGNIPKLVMMDNSLSIQAKGFYAYLCVFAGENAIASPNNKNEVINHLQISPEAYVKYIKELEKNGYISKTRRNENGRFGSFVFCLNAVTPELDTVVLDTVVPDTVVPDTVVPDTVVPDTVVSDTVVSDTNKTKPLSQTKNNKNKSKQTAACARADTADAVDEHLRAEFNRFIAEYPPVPYNEAKALKAFKKLPIPMGELMNSLESWKSSPQWNESNGRYIPSPVTFFENGYYKVDPTKSNDAPTSDSLPNSIRKKST